MISRRRWPHYLRSYHTRSSVNFHNFRKKTERERLSLVSNARGEVVTSLLPILDKFERAKSQIKVQAEGEEKINNSYQRISKQFMEILASLGVAPVETGDRKQFDPRVSFEVVSEFIRVLMNSLKSRIKLVPMS